ncbi:MAG: DUF5610 domain-containing protein [Gammaproteobacteria bacterium]|nr:DUF5610 domain-containing protein [Gammaproteobacteria bacterium]
MKTQAFGQQVQELAKSDNKKTEGPFGQTISELAKSKEQLNASILKSNADVNISIGNESLSLVFRTALEGINDALKATMGDNAIQNAYDSGLDVSPDATAERIVSLSTAFFSSYQEQHPELSQQEALIKFTDLISGGIDTGFSEARDILSGLNVLEGDIASNIDSTYDLVQEKLTAFIESFNQDEQEVDEDS